MVTGLAKQRGNGFHRKLVTLVVGLVTAALPRISLRAVIVGTERGLNHAGDHGGTARGADGAGHHGILIAHTLSGQSIEVGRLDGGLTVATKVRRGVFNNNPKDIGAMAIGSVLSGRRIQRHC
ncbi:hypothetical protein N8586_02795 [Verrucomicrobiales bacterium]|nr:hypothetical protein [Verrucomicrobiales bacterium]